MGNAVIRTVTDPDTGESIDIMAFQNAGKVRFQRLRSFEERMTTPRAWENLATFGETASKAYGLPKTGPLPPAAEVVQRERPWQKLSSAGKDREAKQRRYMELLGSQIPGIHEELVLREAVSVPFLHALPGNGADDIERVVRARLATVRAPFLR